MNGRFEGATAFVTGAGSGIGRACGERLAAEGASILCFDVDGTIADTESEFLSIFRCDSPDNRGRYCSPAFERLMDEARTLTDRRERNADRRGHGGVHRPHRRVHPAHSEGRQADGRAVRDRLLLPRRHHRVHRGARGEDQVLALSPETRAP